MNTLNRRILAAECSMKIMELLIKSDEQNLPKDLICSLQELIIEIDKCGNDQPRDDRGRWTNAGGGESGGSSSGGGKKNKPPKMSKKEINKVSHGIATDFPKLEADGKKRKYEYGNYSYSYYVNGFGSYSFVSKKKLR